MGGTGPNGMTEQNHFAVEASEENIMRTITTKARALLSRLGVTDNYIGARYTVYALTLCVWETDRLLHVTKQIYPAVARRFGVSWQAVERDMRTVVAAAWRNNRELLNTLAYRPLHQKPYCVEFLSILATHLRSDIPSLAWDHRMDTGSGFSPASST